MQHTNTDGKVRIVSVPVCIYYIYTHTHIHVRISTVHLWRQLRNRTSGVHIIYSIHTPCACCLWKSNIYIYIFTMKPCLKGSQCTHVQHPLSLSFSITGERERESEWARVQATRNQDYCIVGCWVIGIERERERDLSLSVLRVISLLLLLACCCCYITQ